MTIDNHKKLGHRLFVDFQYQSINWHRLSSFDRLIFRSSISWIVHVWMYYNMYKHSLSLREVWIFSETILNYVFEILVQHTYLDLPRCCLIFGNFLYKNLALHLSGCVIGQISAWRLEILNPLILLCGCLLFWLTAFFHRSMIEKDWKLFLDPVDQTVGREF